MCTRLRGRLLVPVLAIGLIVGTAFANGMRAAGWQTSIKHFPGLGRVRGNIDVTANVGDKVTTRTARR